jgi:hypothetical protein
MENTDLNNNPAIMGGDFIKEADEYSEETHSDDESGNMGGRRKVHNRKVNYYYFIFV